MAWSVLALEVMLYGMALSAFAHGLDPWGDDRDFLLKLGVVFFLVPGMVLTFLRLRVFRLRLRKDGAGEAPRSGGEPTLRS